MMMKHILLSISGLLLVSGCTQPSGEIAAAPVAGSPFASYDCNGLRSERISMFAKLDEARQVQDKKAVADALTVTAIGIPLSSGQDQAQAIAVIRGYVAEIDREATEKGCTDPVFGSKENRLGPTNDAANLKVTDD